MEKIEVNFDYDTDNGMEYVWQRALGGGARLLRVFTDRPQAKLSESVGGLPLTEIGEYCFSDRERLPDGIKPKEPGMRPLSGPYIEKLYLPGTVRGIDSFAFFNCTSLTELSIGANLEEVGSDAFMNCTRFASLVVRCEVTEKSGIRQIVSRISSDMEVTFEGDGGKRTVVLFPDYYESYDEIAPAHIFGRNIEGEGFRARQCFKGGVMDFSQYDGIFQKICAEETVATALRLAEDRLRYPAGLSDAAREQYAGFLITHADELLSAAVRERDAERVAFLCEAGIAGRDALQRGIALASSESWAAGAAAMIRMMGKIAMT